MALLLRAQNKPASTVAATTVAASQQSGLALLPQSNIIGVTQNLLAKRVLIDQ
jgi:hypothetical protein